MSSKSPLLSWPGGQMVFAAFLVVSPFFVSVSRAEQVEAEDFSRMSGVEVEDKGETSDSLGYIDDGDWADYVITVPEAGEYRISFRVASNTSGGDIEVVTGGVTIGTATVGDTNGWESWVTVSTIATFSRAGRTAVRLNFVGTSGTSLYNLDWFAFEVPQPVTLTVGSELRQKMRYGLDYERLWFWYGSSANKRQVAQWSMVDCDVDYIRVAINSAYELEEGEYNLRAYTDKIIPMMTEMKRAKRDIKFFASPRPLNEAISGARWQPYPRWITGDSGGSFNFDWQKCAEYLVRYVELMKSYGFKISFMDLTNEWNFVTPTHVRDISEYMKAELAAGDMPLIIAPSAWSYAQGRSWMNGVTTGRRRDAIDIAACHNTDKTGTAQDFADRVKERLPGADKEIWNTELHGWKGKVPAEEIPTSSFMFECIRAGFHGINGWLAIGTTNQGHCYFLNNGTTVTRNVKYYIFQKLANTSNYGHALDVNQPDELTSTAALVKDGLLTVWALNNSGGPVSIDVDLGEHLIGGTVVKQTRWHESVALSGVASNLTRSEVNRFSATVEANSLCCYEVPLASLSAMDLAVETREGRAVPVTLTGSASDGGGDLTFRLASVPSEGTLSGSIPNLVYTPDAGFVGNDEFSFYVREDGVDSEPATVSIAVRGGQLLAHWPCDDGVGRTVADVSGNGYNASGFSGSWSSGISGGALRFDGVSAGAALPLAPFRELGGEMSISMWVRGGDTQPADDSVLYATTTSGGRALNIHLPWSDSKVYWDAGLNEGYDRISKTAVSGEISGQWNHWVFSKQASTGVMAIHLNGQPWASGTGKVREISDIRTVVLGGQGSSHHYEGKVDEVMLFNYAMTDSEVAELYGSYPEMSEYNVWLESYPELTDVRAAGDPDGDGVPTGIEFVVNGNPMAAESGLLPTLERSGGGVVFSFVRKTESTASSTQVVQIGSDLSGWSDFPVSGPGTPAEVSVQVLGGGLERVTLTIDDLGAAGSEIYFRLKVEM